MKQLENITDFLTKPTPDAVKRKLAIAITIIEGALQLLKYLKDAI